MHLKRLWITRRAGMSARGFPAYLNSVFFLWIMVGISVTDSTTALVQGYESALGQREGKTDILLRGSLIKINPRHFS